MMWKLARKASGYARILIFFVRHGVWLKSCGRNIELVKDGKLRIGKGVVIESNAYICVEKDAMLSVGNNVHLGRNVYIKTYGGRINIHSDVSINAFSFLNGAGGLHIGRGTRIGSHTSIISSNHLFDDEKVPIREQGTSREGIVIEGDCWLGTGVRVLDGVSIGEGCILAAGAVVNKSFSSSLVLGGVPAKVIKERFEGK